MTSLNKKKKQEIEKNIIIFIEKKFGFLFSIYIKSYLFHPLD